LARLLDHFGMNVRIAVGLIATGTFQRLAAMTSFFLALG
jgi:hypothetical protein